MATGARSVLIVESRAHERAGHFPVRCAQLAEAYAALGFHVELLTSIGWARASEHPAPSFTVRQWRPWVRWARRTERPWAVTVLGVLEARARARRMSPPPDLVVVLAWSELPELLTVFAPSRTRGLVQHWGLPTRLPRVRGVDALAVRRERRRRATGGALRLTVAHEHLRRDWAVRAPYLDPVVAPVVGVRDLTPSPDARAELGLPVDIKLALFFGDTVLKRRDVVLDAFAALDGWTLVVGGPLADHIPSAPGVVRFPGVVDDVVRDQLFAAVDVVVLSFSPRYPNESGTLMDAISAGTPVVCSDDALVAETVVTPYRLGPTFAADDPAALADAVRTAPAAIDPDDLARARRELSNRAVARRQLELVGLEPSAG